MIVVYVNSMADTATFSKLYEGLEDLILLYNPTREEVDKVLNEKPNEKLMLFGHGDSRGLFSADFIGGEYIIDKVTVPLLQKRGVIGIWCYASEFARMNNLRGFFTYMFISNLAESLLCGCNIHEENVIFKENKLFSLKINELIKNNVPMEEWQEILYKNANTDLDFVEFNYSNLSYFDGVNNFVPRSPLYENLLSKARAIFLDDLEELEYQYIICFTDNNGENRWERCDSYDKMVERVDKLSNVLKDENVSNVMIFSERKQVFV